MNREGRLHFYPPDLPEVFAEDPESGGVEEEARDEEQQVEVGVHLVHRLLPAGQVMVAGRVGEVA